MSIDWGLDAEDAQAAAEADNALAQVLAGDAKFVIDQTRTVHEIDPSFASALNLRHFGIIGHSRGGTTVGRACATISDIVACAVIDDIGPDRPRTMADMPKPRSGFASRAASRIPNIRNGRRLPITIQI